MGVAVSNLFNPWNDPAAITLNGATTGTGKALPMNICRQIGWFTERTGTLTAGVYVIEWADSIDYAGTWREIAEINATDVETGDDGAGEYPGPKGFVRARVTTPIVGGTITVYLNGLRG